MKKMLILLIVFMSFMLLLNINVNSTNLKTDLLNTKNLEIENYQNITINYPSWENGLYLNTYDQYEQLQLLPYASSGGWQSEIYTIKTIFIYNVQTICYDETNIMITFYYNFGAGWMNLPISPLNQTLNMFLNGNWEFMFVINLTRITNSPIVYNFRVFYIDDIEFIPNPFILTNPLLELVVVLILFIFLLFVYLKIKSISLMIIVYLLFLIVSITFFFDVLVPFYPFAQLFFVSIGSYLFIDLILDYKKQEGK